MRGDIFLLISSCAYLTSTTVAGREKTPQFDYTKFQIENVKYRDRNIPVDVSNSSLLRSKRASATKRESSVAANVTSLLNEVLYDYNQHFRPGFESKTATKVLIDLFVRTMGPVADLANTYSFNCYFRQQWRDERLQFNNSFIGFRQLSLSMAMLDKIWKPDTYFWNGAGSYIHSITTSNRLVRLSPDGTILFSSRITVKARCLMDMSRYPLDKQACRLVLGSYAYSANEMQYEWKTMGQDKGIKVDQQAIADLPQFSLTGFKVLDAVNLTRDAEYSALEVRFFFERHFGYFLMNFYVPCTLIVLLCWVAFFTQREATGERIGIGITNVLTIVLISLDSKSDSPKVDSPTALDVYIWICYFAHLICMVEFTVVHLYTKFNTGDPEIQQVERERLRQIIKQIPKNAVLSNRRQARRPAISNPPIRKFTVPFGRQSLYQKVRFSSVRFAQKKHGQMRMSKLDEEEAENEKMNIDSFREENVGWRLYYWMRDRELKTDPFGVAQNSISRIDRVAIVVAPIAFILVLVLYYDLYVNRPIAFKFDDQINHFSKM